MKRILGWAGGLAAVLFAAFWWATSPPPAPGLGPQPGPPDPLNGERVFHAGGCASCHGEDLAGGLEMPSDFGTFRVPNISPHPEAGIGGWSFQEFATAVVHGVSPEGAHYYPAFPYTAYAMMEPQDVADLWAYIQTLPQDATPSQAHDVGFPFNIRRSVGGWKWLFVDESWVVEDAPERGRYLVEALAHCGECHTPRNALGALDRDRWLEGAPNPAGRGTIPDLTPGELTWSAADIAYYLETGFTPDFDSAGGHMAEVVENFSKLPDEDRQAVAAYLKALPDD